MGTTPRIFDTNRRIRLGIWGLGRGMHFYRTCSLLHFDVVAGCDYNDHMRAAFLAANPGAFVTADVEEFLAQDFDAVLLATFCPAHAADAMRCLRAGKHVLSEVTAFHTLAEGVQLVEAVERSGLVYNLAENYPFSPANRYLARKWREGLFGELQYAEYEYVHECRALAYTYIDGTPILPGHTVHSWRSWMDYHYYCTHSLGPIMVISGARPARVVALPGAQTLPGYPLADGMGMGQITPSIIELSNGAVVRNLMGATTNDTHQQRLWGTKGSAEWHDENEITLRLGGSGMSPKFAIAPSLEALDQLAADTGHGGGDFWVLYYFARQLLFGEPAPFDIYHAADVTIPGIQALRSAQQDGAPQEVPDFRNPAARDAYRHDTWAQPPLDTRTAMFPADADLTRAASFSATMQALIDATTRYRAYADWATVIDDVRQPHNVIRLLDTLIAEFPQLQQTYRAARQLIDAYPESNAARVLREMLTEVGDEARVMAPGFLDTLIAQQQRWHAHYPCSVVFTDFSASPLYPAPPAITHVDPPHELPLTPIAAYNASYLGVDTRSIHGGQDGLLFLQSTLTLPTGGVGTLLYGADGPVRVWLNGEVVGCEPAATNPLLPDEYRAFVRWRTGTNTVLFALATHHGRAWGVSAQALVEEPTPAAAD